MKLFSRFIRFLVPLLLAVIFFWQFFYKGLIPIPADTIVGLYHPYRDFYSGKFPRGIPYKNFLITDPVRQTYPWKNLAIELEKLGKLPLWNPYSFAGAPLLANFQTGAFYPLNIIFFIFPFSISWSLFIILEMVLMSSFMYLYLKNLGLKPLSSVFGAIVFSLGGYSIAWLEWGNILHTLLWLPLILFSVDKIMGGSKVIKWSLVFLLALIFSFLAGHLQIFFYIFVVVFLYILLRLLEHKEKKKMPVFFFLIVSFCLLTFYQWGPTLRFIKESARFIDQGDWQKLGWFVPWQNLTQFVSPDFFGNPATLNYRGIFNYGEFVGYVGIIPLVLAIFAAIFLRRRTISFFGFLLLVSLIFCLPNFISQIPFVLKIPFISSAQPTRLMAIVDFSLAVLAAYGFENFKSKLKNLHKVIVVVGLIIACLWLYVLKFHIGTDTAADISVSKNNLIFPTIVFSSAILLFIPGLLKKRWLEFLLIGIVLTDLLRFGWKFTPFTERQYLYPNTKALLYLESQGGQFRIMTNDRKIFSPNFSIMYKIQSLEGYDPLYLKRYGELIASMDRNEPNINPPFGFDRIITPDNFESEIADLLNVKYVLSLSDISSGKLFKVFQEGETRIYENKNVLERVFFVKETVEAKGEKDAIRKLFENRKILKNVAIVEGLTSNNYSIGDAKILTYTENSIKIKTSNPRLGFLILTDSFYPTWKAKIDGKETKIYLSDFNFRGVEIPKGEHIVEFNVGLL